MELNVTIEHLVKNAFGKTEFAPGVIYCGYWIVVMQIILTNKITYKNPGKSDLQSADVGNSGVL